MSTNGWTQQPVPESMRTMYAPPLVSPRVYEKHGLRAILGREYCGGRDSDPLRWHLSVSHHSRVPTWGEMRDACHDLRPGVTFSIGVPPLSLWMNEHDFVLHAWETVDPALFEEYRTNARGDQPTY